MTQQDYIEELKKAQKQIQVLHQRLSLLETTEKKLPQTMMLSDSFLKRSFAVFGHTFVASIIISLPFYLIMFALIMFLGVAL